MPRPRALLTLPTLLLAASSLFPAPAAASGFAPTWTLTGWDFLQDIGTTDGDPQHELMFASKVDGHLALVDGLTGVVAKEFPEFTSTNTLFTVQDVDGDGPMELFFSRPPAGLVTPLTTVYDWNGTIYATLYSHTDTVSVTGGVKSWRSSRTSSRRRPGRTSSITRAASCRRGRRPAGPRWAR